VHLLLPTAFGFGFSPTWWYYAFHFCNHRSLIDRTRPRKKKPVIIPVGAINFIGNPPRRISTGYASVPVQTRLVQFGWTVLQMPCSAEMIVKSGQ
jgi:hypothetical protein